MGLDFIRTLLLADEYKKALMCSKDVHALGSSLGLWLWSSRASVWELCDRDLIGVLLPRTLANQRYALLHEIGVSLDEPQACLISKLVTAICDVLCLVLWYNY